MIAKIQKILRKAAIFFILKWVASKSRSTHDVMAAMLNILDEI